MAGLVTTKARMAAVAAVPCDCDGEAHDTQDRGCPQNMPVRVIEAILQAAAEPIAATARRQVAIHILALDAQDRQQMERTNNKGPYYDMRTSLRRLTRGEPLPRIVSGAVPAPDDESED